MMFRKYLVPILFWLIYSSLRLTWRVKIIECDALKSLVKEKKPFILAHWHGDELVLLPMITRYSLATIASTSKDGESMNTLIKLFGGITTRGSSTRGGVQALKGLIRLMKEGKSTSFAVDGPKGPIYKVKPGIFEIAKLCRGPIFWSGVFTDRAWHFPKSWNKTYLPKPFAKVLITWSGPLALDLDNLDPKDQNTAESLANCLAAAREEASKQFASSGLEG